MYTTHICSMNDQSLVTPHLRSLVRADLTRTQTQSMPAGILRVLLQTKLAIMMKFHPNKKISKSPCPGNLNSTRQYSGDGYQINARCHVCLHFNEIFVDMFNDIVI